VICFHQGCPADGSSLELNECLQPAASRSFAPWASAVSSEVTADRCREVYSSAVPVVEVLLLGERHDAPDHHQIEQQVNYAGRARY
jgi:hypothetical protein